ncbi:hypothetical protein BO78DRAFT_443287 [Aspergillus sclerotiicarbonarius CBS 121057]|uniref:Uncharacterized protein n=1 Tax=Aspergillus sclerotiicarbonarius (strain CBS 121057 / IBT 28362) TaxID=1448318 RepID=A0A319EB46_ASPSB|nr:hypothetical protein BO78DRAFT_443287 [Aspergillus sclerotiicarbonarius CBS 121057]
MPPRHQRSVPWREKRKARGPVFDPKKKAKADRERFRRGKEGSFKRLNDLYLDGLDTGRERRIYVVISSTLKGPHGSIQYVTYNSHPKENWIPPVDEVAEGWPKTEEWTPENFKRKEKKQVVNGDGEAKRRQSRKRLFTISQPPLWNLPQTPTLA